MKFETTLAFDNDYRRLKVEHAAEFKKVVREKFIQPATPSQPTRPRPGRPHFGSRQSAAQLASWK